MYYTIILYRKYRNFVYLTNIFFLNGKIKLGDVMLSERLLDIRDEAELNQEDMAEILKVSQSNYSRWENGKELIPLSKLNILCNYFKVNMDYVIGISRNFKCEKKYTFNNEMIGKRLKEFRKENGITQVKLAEFLNTTQSTISAYESGKTTLLTAFALQIVDKYKISLDWFCGRK